MKRITTRFSILLLVLVMLMQLSPNAVAYPAPNHGAQDGVTKFEKEIPMSFTHRSAWRLAPENSLPAIYHSIAMGIDAVEVDVMLSKDGVLALMHDTTIDRNVVGYTGKVADYNWSQLKSMPLRPEQGGSGTTKFTMTAAQAKIMNTLPNYAAHYGKAAASGDTVNVARFDDCLDLMAIHGPKTMVTIDKCSSQAVFVACYKLLREKGMLGNAYFKISQSVSTLNTWATAAANAWNSAYPSDKITQADVKNSIIYMHVMGTPNESTLQSHLNNGSYLKAVEVTYNATNAANCESLITGSFDAFCDKNNIGLYCSTISTGGWSGGRPDSEKTWAYMLGIGFDGIQTDRASELADYLYDYNRQRASSETIQAESFHNMNSVDAYFSLPLEADSSMNKVVNNLRNGEWLEYRNIYFTGKEYQLRIGVRGLLKGATLKFYVDSISNGNLIGTYTLAADSAVGVKTIDLSKTVSAGEHKVFVQASGTAGKNLANLDYFGFTRDAAYLYFDYTNTSADQSRYNRKTYGNVNYDLATSWFTPDGRTDGTVVADGNISITVKANDTTTYHYIETGTYWENHPLNYTAGPEDVCQVRFKIDNAVSSKTNGYGEFILFYGVDKSEINNKSVRVAFKMSDVVDKGFVSYTIPMDANWKGNVTSIRAFINQIQNASGKRTKITFDYIYIGPKSWMPEQNHLYFGFDNTNTDKMRYSARPYGGLNYDLASNWWYQSSRTTPPSISDGAISFTILPSDSTAYQYIQTGKTNTVSQYPLRFTPGDKDYCQVRLKIDNAVSASADGKTSGFNLFYGYGNIEPGEQRNDEMKFDLTQVVNKGYFTLLFPMDSSYYLDADQITTIRPFVNQIKSAPSKAATVTIDYVYVGPLDSVPETDNLLFHFTNKDSDIARYNSYSYGYQNFDRPNEAFWGTNATAQGEGTNYNNFTIDNAAGTAIVKVGDDLEGEKEPGPKFMTSTAYGVFPWNGRGGYAPLNYRPTKAQYFQIRFKLDNVVDTGNNTIQLEYHYDNAKGIDAIKYGDLNAPFTFKTGSYQVLTVPLSSTFKNAAKITSFGVRFMNIKSADSAKLGTVTIDYMYVGTLAGLPTPAYTVTFKDAAGKILATQLVNKGESATYEGATPTKAYDANYHYTFKGWDKALTNITANTTINAQYNSIAHSYTYAKVDATNHKATCSCGYNKTVAHTWNSGSVTTQPTCTAAGVKTYTCTLCSQTKTESVAKLGHNYTNYKATKNPTTSATGVLTGTCSRCSGTTTVTLPKLNTTDYTKTVTKAATCTATGTDSYKWKTTTYGSFTFTATTAALGHSYSYKATKNPTTSATGVLTGTCSRCSGTTTVTLPKLNTTDYTKTVTKAATCTATGTDSYKWKTTTYGSFTFTATTAALGHSYTTKVTASTCTAQGYTTYTCSRCTHSYKDTYVAAKGHTEVIDKAVVATCTAAGKTEGKHCSVCKAVLVAQQTIPAKGHTEVIDKAVAATCTAAGKTEGKHCSVCNAVLVAQQTIPAKGHTEVIDKAVAATCTTAGKTEGKHCSVCNAVLVAQQTIPAKGHTEVIDKAVAATCTAAGKTEGKHCSVCKAVLVTPKTIPATGHSYIYTTISALVHSITCKNCDYAAEDPHSYKDGLCICGEPEIKDTVQDPKLKLGHTLNLASDISVNLVIHKLNLEGFDLSTIFVESILETYKDNEKIGTTTIRLEPTAIGDYYYFTLKGLTAVQMNDRIVSTLFGIKEGQPYCSVADSYSIADYAYSQLSKATMSESLKTLCADLLRYGAKAQIFKNYRTDALADSKLTEAYKSYLSDLESVSFGNTNAVLNDLENAPIEWFGKALNLDSKVMLRFVFRPISYTGDLSKVTAHMTYKDMTGATKTLILKDPELYNGSLGLYTFTTDALLAAELRAVVSVRIFEGNTPLSCTLQYSADTYANNKTGTLLDLCKALFAYSDSAKSYFLK